MSFHGFPRYQPLGLTWILEHRHWLDFHQRLIDSGAMDTWLWLLFPFLASSWYLPGIAPHDYMLAEILGQKLGEIQRSSVWALLIIPLAASFSCVLVQN